MTVSVVARLSSLSPDVVHDLVFPLPRDIGIGEDHFDVLPARVGVQTDVDVIS